MSKTENQKSINFLGYIIFIAILLVTLLGSYYVVSPGHRGVLVTLGRVEQQSYLNGIGFKLPVISKMIQINVQTNTITEKASSYTLDVQTAEIDYTITYNLNPENVYILYEEIGLSYVQKKIIPVVRDVIKDVIGKWQAQDLVANRDKARSEILAQMQSRIDDRFFQNITFQIIDLNYSNNFERAIESKVIAEQRAQEAVNNTKRIKEEAEQKLISAKADAEAMEIKSEALAKNKGLTEYEAVQKWNGTLPRYMMGNSIPFINLKAE